VGARASAPIFTSAPIAANKANYAIPDIGAKFPITAFALKKLAGALHAEAVTSTLSLGLELKLEIQANNSSRLYPATIRH
jgi:hypothetical protein